MTEFWHFFSHIIEFVIDFVLGQFVMKIYVSPLQSPQKTQQLNREHEILEENHKKIVVKEVEKKEGKFNVFFSSIFKHEENMFVIPFCGLLVLKQSSLNFINNLQPEETIWRGEEKSEL